MEQEILVAPIVIDKLREIKAASAECCSILRKNRDLKDVEPFEALQALEQEVKRASEGIDAALYILRELLEEQASKRGV